MRARLYRSLKQEGGFTLPEMMVTIVIMLMVMFALYSIFDMSIRVFRFGNDKVEATENARLGLEKMEREIRAAHPVDADDDAQQHLFFNATGAGSARTSPYAGPFNDPVAQITFGNDRDESAVGTIDCPNAEGECEYITYKLTQTDDPDTAADESANACPAPPSGVTCTLRRVNMDTSSNLGDPVAEFVRPGGLTFTYLNEDNEVPASEADVVKVLVRLQISVNGRTQTLTTSIDLRNRTMAS